MKNANIIVLVEMITGESHAMARRLMMANFEITKNNINVVKELVQTASENALEECGLLAEKYAIQKAPRDTGYLRNHITHVVTDEGESSKAMYVGTNVEYAIYQEFGTGIYASNGGGRKTPWLYKDEKGQTHFTHGNKPHPFVKPAISEHMKTYAGILKSHFKGK